VSTNNTYAPAKATVSKISPNDLVEKKVDDWQFPYMEDTRSIDSDKTNAINRKREWKYEPPEPEEEILPPTAEEIEAIRQAAYQEGFELGNSEGNAQGHEEGKEQGYQEGKEQGYQEGHQEGLEKGQIDIEEQRDIWQKLVEKLHQPLQLVESQLQTELVYLAVSLAKGVIKTELETNDNIIFQALSEGLKALPIGEKTYQIHMNPEDLQLVKAHFNEEEIAKHNWHLVEAIDLSRGGCDIVTNSNGVDVTIERRLKDVIDQFMTQQGLTLFLPTLKVFDNKYPSRMR
jgi:flagellar assembly protein FliH